MNQFFSLSLLAAVVALLLAAVAPAAVSAQLEPTPILGEPEIVTPLATAEGSGVPPGERAAEPAPAASAAPSQPTAAVATPDRCEPNDAPERACALPLDAVSGPFTFVPEGDQDFFRLDLPQEASIQTVITVRSTDGLDLALAARQEERLVASGSYSLTLAPEITGPVVLRVENRDPRPAAGEQYRVEVRREIVPPDVEEEEAAEGPAPDALENNWSFETASPIAVGVVYDLSFACPDPRPNACPGGDHDYLLVPVKAGARYLVATFDLDPGVDTVVELFWGTTTEAVAGSDDYAPGGALSALRWTAPADGILGVRVAPRNGGLSQQIAEPEAGYRFAVAPLATELAQKLDATIHQQANVPTPTATRVAAPASSAAGSAAAGGSGAAASGGTSATPESIAAGEAVVVRETLLRREPRENGEALATLPPESRVAVRGPVSGSWVSVESDRSILPGWVRAADLQRIADPAAGSSTPAQGATPPPMSQQPGAATQPTATPTIGVSPDPSASSGRRDVAVTELDPVLPEPPPPPVARVPFAVSITVALGDGALGGAFSLATPTPDLSRAVARVRVQLVNAFGDLLAEGLSSDQGDVTLTHDVRPGDALLVRVPAWGVEVELAADQTRVDISLPEATS